MRRYWLDKEARSAELVKIEGEAFHHIFDVCRQNVGDNFEVLFGDGKAYLVTVLNVAKKFAECEILEERALAPLKSPYLHLCVSIPRFPVFEAVLEKAVELGTLEVHPYFSDFSFVKTKDAVSENRMERWKKIVKSATQQTGRGDLMAIHEPLKLSELLKTFNLKTDAAGLFCYEGQGQKDIKSWAQEIPNPPQEIWVFIGSEGGFSAQEIQKFQELRLPPVTLGAQVLRVETACVAILSVLKYQWGLFQ